jgi:hypothetical protein
MVDELSKLLTRIWIVAKLIRRRRCILLLLRLLQPGIKPSLATCKQQNDQKQKVSHVFSKENE